MSYNHYRDELIALGPKILRCTSEARAIEQHCIKYDNFKLQLAQERTAALSSDLSKQAAIVEAIATILNFSSKSIIDLEKEAPPGWNPLSWFSDARRKLLQEIREAKTARALYQTQSTNAQAALDEMHSLHKELEESLAWYMSFDRAGAREQYEQLSERIVELRAQVDRLQPKCAKLDEQVAPLLSSLADAERRRDAARDLLAKAQAFDRDLNQAGNSYEKRMIHERCRIELGHDKPAQVASRARREAETAERDIEKLTRSLSTIAARDSRRIDRLVFDGNNFCYGRSNEFIGIAPLQAIAPHLSPDICKIMVFDASIRRRGFNESKLSNAIGSGVIVHIVNGAADETLLDLAAGEHDYVVSNDRFVDYPTKPVVLGQRVFRHERVDNRIMIHELDVSTTFA